MSTMVERSLALPTAKVLWLCALSFFAFLPLEAWAQSLCGPRVAYLKQLAAEHGEVPVAAGLVSNGGLLEVLTSPSGSWTILVTQPNGMACLVAAGESWQSEKPAVPGRDL